ncbi:peptidylprolyl isomerase [Patescibacteria group bacterium]|nr:peptidylprolyl isomerase [Patescibacteria group bacterium]
MSYDLFKKRNLKIASAIFFAILLFITLFGIGIYKLSWKSRTTYVISRILPYPAILVDWEGIAFHTYVDDLQTLEKYWNYQRENRIVLLGIPDKKEIRENLVNKLITEKIIKIYARKNGITVDDEELYLEWEKLKARPEAEEEITRFLNDAYGWTDLKFIDRVLYPFLLQQKVKAVLAQEAGDSEENLLENAREIYILAAEKGADFSELAKKFSEDDFSAPNGGDLGYFGRGTMDPYFEEAVFSMRINEISGPVKSSYGYHIIKVEDLLYNDETVATQARVRHILIKGFDFDEWIKSQKQDMAIYRLVL